MISLAESEVTLSGAMRRVAGTNHLPLTEALQLSLDVVRMVARAHDEGKVIGVLDAAHLVCRPGGVLSFGGVGGNPVAPELNAGEKPDRLSDVYALGALIYRLLTGRKVDPMRVIEPPSHFNPAVDSELDELVLRALDEDPSERPYSARALEQSLVDICAELGLAPDSHSEATRLLDGSLPVGMRTIRHRAAVEEDDDEEDLAPAGGPVAKFLYDLGINVAVKPTVRRGVDDAGADEPRRPRTRLGQFMYDLGWLQGIDWDAPETRTWLKRGGIACAVLLALLMLWPSGTKGPRPGSAQALAASALLRDGARPLNTKVESKATAVAPKVVAKPAQKARRTR